MNIVLDYNYYGGKDLESVKQCRILEAKIKRDVLLSFIPKMFPLESQFLEANKVRKDYDECILSIVECCEEIKSKRIDELWGAIDYLYPKTDPLPIRKMRFFFLIVTGDSIKEAVETYVRGF